ncbi:polysaccharide deacetylase family protein [Paenibacillus sp. LMG 31456]|uniref:Polysaccharide deacetylase family protein n=1 Tax=Paenibacillus foliorum TaxID=2654974 RepID=A0A972JZ98_9BACL|nr:polysaccharide deacetylase family protein [Paenibacillus foliorum]NOU93381.1 polysaccharide deacetylase family protein [Paenibacillus foliorum]
MKYIQVIMITCLFATVMLVLQSSESVKSFIQYTKQHSANVPATSPFHMDNPSAIKVNSGLGKLQDQTAMLQEKIMLEADKRRIAPINAQLDRVWKAIPGYNGVEVDVEKSLALTLERQTPGQLHLIMREVPPAIGLEQLGSHPIYKGNPNKPMVSLMINVAWGEQYLPKMLSILEKENVRATFFFDGSWLKKNIPTAQIIKDKGHELSNHAYSHKNMSQISRDQAYQEIFKTQQLLEKELGVVNVLFAPPSGDFNQATVDIARQQKLKTILWTLDTVDWQKPSPSTIVNKISARIEPGSLVLMHPTSSSSEALERMIKVIKNKGLQLGTVSEVISSDRIPKVESAEQ